VRGAGVVRGMRGRASACPWCVPVNVKWTRLVRESGSMCLHRQASCFRAARGEDGEGGWFREEFYSNNPDGRYQARRHSSSATPWNA